VRSRSNNAVYENVLNEFNWRNKAMHIIIKVSAQSEVKKVAGAISAFIKEKGEAEIQAIGAGAVNQTAKAIAITQGYLGAVGFSIVSKIGFAEVEIEGKTTTAIRFIVKKV
jgi:stage V sporulation protein S